MSSPDLRTTPLTLDRFARSFAVKNPQPVRVQVKRRGAVHCGVPVDFFEPETGGVMFKVATSCGDMWAADTHVRQCSGVDGGCACSGESACHTLPLLQIVPPSNEGHTSSACLGCPVRDMDTSGPTVYCLSAPSGACELRGTSGTPLGGTGGTGGSQAVPLGNTGNTSLEGAQHV